MRMVARHLWIFAPIAVALSLAVASGCHDGPGLTRIVALNAARKELDAARVRWRAAAIDDYTYDFRRGLSLRPPENTARIRATVRDGRVVGAFYLEDVPFVIEGDPFAAGDPVPERVLRIVVPIEGWFDDIAEMIDIEPEELEIQYHPRLGYPELFAGSTCISCPDAGWRHRIEDLVPIEEEGEG